MIEDAELLRRYVEERSQEAFATVVDRHLPLVYHAALRQCGDRQFAEDVAQVVFTDLARKARALSNHEVLAGWLHTSTRYAVLQVMRTERRRIAREQGAFAMNRMIGEATAHDDAWVRLRPVIDDALQALGERERQAVLLRFFENRPLAEIGARLAISEDAARMRVDRALDKLQALLTRRGVTSTSAALSVALTTQAIAATPAGLVAHISTAALAGAAVSGGVGATAAVTFMSMTKLQLGIVGAIVVAGAGGYALQERTQSALEREALALRHEARSLQVHAENVPRRADATDQTLLARKHDEELAALAEAARELKAQHEAATRAATERHVTRASTPFAPRAPALDAANLDRAPKVKSRAPLKYPSEMLRGKIEGEVVVEYTVDAEGVVRDAVAVRSSRPEFEAAALESVNQWRYDAGVKGGRMVNTRTQQIIKFSVEKNPLPVSNWF